MQGKIALVTGAAKGLGKAFSKILLQRGAQVCLADLNADVGRVTEKEFQKEFGANSAVFHPCDVTKDADVNNLFKKAKDQFGNLDIVINNAGIMHEGNWEAMLDINLTSLIRVTKVAMETMGKCNQGNGGVIINIASAAGVLPMPFGPVYCASKFGVVGYSRSFKLYQYRKKYGVRVNCLCPAFAMTDILKISEDGGEVVGMETAKKNIEYAGVMTPEHVAESMLVLIEDERLNGDVLLVTKFGKRLMDYKERTLDDFLKSAL